MKLEEKVALELASWRAVDYDVITDDDLKIARAVIDIVLESAAKVADRSKSDWEEYLSDDSIPGAEDENEMARNKLGEAEHIAKGIRRLKEAT